MVVILFILLNGNKERDDDSWRLRKWKSECKRKQKKDISEWEIKGLISYDEGKKEWKT